MAHKFLSSVPSIYKQGAGEDKGDVARLQAFIGAIAIGDLVKSTLGRDGCLMGFLKRFFFVTRIRVNMDKHVFIVLVIESY